MVLLLLRKSNLQEIMVRLKDRIKCQLKWKTIDCDHSTCLTLHQATATTTTTTTMAMAVAINFISKIVFKQLLLLLKTMIQLESMKLETYNSSLQKN